MNSVGIASFTSYYVQKRYNITGTTSNANATNKSEIKTANIAPKMVGNIKFYSSYPD